MNSKKIYLTIILFCLLLAIFVPVSSKAQFVQCGNSASLPTYDATTGACTANCPCTICDFFNMLARIYDFIVKDIATPLAVLALTIGGIILMISAGNPGLAGLGKKIIYAALIGLFLAFGSFIIIDFILHAIGYSASWSSLSLSC
jgi:hypothetical protein